MLRHLAPAPPVPGPRQSNFRSNRPCSKYPPPQVAVDPRVVGMVANSTARPTGMTASSTARYNSTKPGSTVRTNGVAASSTAKANELHGKVNGMAMRDIEMGKGVAAGMEPEELTGEEPEGFSNQMNLFNSCGIALTMFYATYYTVAAILSAALGTPFTGLEPFEHEAFTPAADSDDMRPLAVWLAMVLSFSFFGPWIIYFSVSNSEAAIAVATVLQGLHMFATTILTQAFPENWVWWATVMPCFFVQGRLAQFMLMQFGLGLCSRSRWRRIAADQPLGPTPDRVVGGRAAPAPQYRLHPAGGPGRPAFTSP